MGRYYHLSKVITDAESKEIEKEMKALKGVEIVEITQDHAYLKVIARENQFSEVMGNAVNICSKVARGVELSFAKFVLES
ncbi:hypothetical protein ACTQ6A_00775 [Lachnospiraceae bacterium LCP25S3_G4]